LLTDRFRFIRHCQRFGALLEVLNQFFSGMVLLALPCMKCFISNLIKIGISALEFCMMHVFLFSVQIGDREKILRLVKA
jgi:hypothetical protein